MLTSGAELTGGLLTGQLSGAPSLVKLAPDPVLYHPFSYSQPLFEALTDLGLVDSTLKFFWQDGNANAPRYWLGAPNVADRLTATGAPTPAQPSGLVDSAGNPITAESYASGQNRVYAGTEFAIGAADECIVIIDLLEERGGVGTYWHGGSYNAINGVLVYRSTTNILFLAVPDTAPGAQTAVVTDLGRKLIVGKINRTLNQISVAINGISTATALNLGAITGDGWGVNANCTGAGSNASLHMANAFFVGPGMFARFTAVQKELEHRVLGLRPTVGSIGTFTRATATSWLAALDRWVIGANGCPCAGDGKGLTAQPARVNKVYNNYNPPNADGWSKVGGGSVLPTLQPLIDPANLLPAVKAECWGPYLMYCENIAGDAAGYAYSGALTANTNPHSLGVIARCQSAGCQLGLRDSVTGVFTALASLSAAGYTWVTFNGVTPGSADEQFCIHVPDNNWVLFVAAQLEEGTRATYPIPNVATAAAATRNQDVFATSWTPSNTQGEVRASVTPRGFSGVEAGADVTVVTRAGGADDLLHAESASTGGWATGDGTTQLTSATVPPATGVEQAVKVQWSGAGQVLEVGSNREVGAYDGARAASGVMQVAPTVASVTVKDLKAYDEV